MSVDVLEEVVVDVLTRERAAEERSSDAAETVLEIQDLSVSNTLTGEEIVRSVDITLTEGQILGIVGESGSGKTVTLRSVLGVLPPALGITHGSISLLGRDVAQLGRREWQELRGNGIAAIFQDPGSYLNPSIPVGKQLAEVLRVRKHLSRSAARAEAIRLFSVMRLANPALIYQQYAHELSGGMLQRVLLAIALSLDPRVLIADEATTALDVTVQAEVLDLLADLRDQLGLAVVVVSHDLAVVAQLADDVIVMRNGEIVERGTTEEVLFSPQHEYTQLLVREHEEYGLERFTQGVHTDAG